MFNRDSLIGSTGNPNQGQTPIKITFLDGTSKIGGYRWHDKDVMCILDYDTRETINIRMAIIKQWIFEPKEKQ